MNSKSGFTLIELIVVIVIVGILAAVSAAKYVDLTTQANKAHDQAQLDACRTVTTLLYASNLLAGASTTTTNAALTFWPSSTNVVYSNMTTAIAWNYYTNVTYNYTNGVWTSYP